MVQRNMADSNHVLGKELPSLFPKPKSNPQPKIEEGYYGPVRDTLRLGFSSVKNNLSYGHPLEFSERNYRQNEDKRDMMMLRNTQGLHAPLKLHLERSLAAKVGRHPCLPSSMVALETLLGLDTTIDFEDFLNNPEDSEESVEPHVVMENHGL